MMLALEIIMSLLTIAGSVYATKQWYDSILRRNTENHSNTEATRLIVNELTITVGKIEKKLIALETQQTIDSQLHTSIVTIEKDLAALKGQFHVLYTLMSRKVDK